ncbi:MULTISPECIES: DUF2793 domain-containing protein [unclassified Novosphingobium]|uniref:DUF2793 domain-containing protein n=1 Tax=unclassified Novosphingobium TaxID=2644732 RepID=UPI000ECAD758|nr:MULTISPECIES: DUF2793 domain-containing protein [unclassified Novosphingobium]HCF24638.1 hypothetical protein [Novosphingobium sp.]HQV04230.1 DUF2793 domain-containing protein [Novosphingobium sp.]
MPDPLFETRTPRLDLPLLFAGQAQKELFVNEVASRLDALLFLAVESELPTPPASPGEGQSWLVAAAPTGDWSGHAGEIASRQSGNWLFTAPVAGMRLLNRSTGQEIRYVTQWNVPAKPTAPSGGTTVDAEARSAINAVISVLVLAGIVPSA